MARVIVNYLDVPIEDVEYLEKHGCEAPSGQTSLALGAAPGNTGDRVTASGE